MDTCEQQPYWIRSILSAEGPLHLRSVDSKSLLVHTRLHLAHSNVSTQSLVDSGCSGCAFIDRSLVQKYKIPTYPMPVERPLLLADGHASDTLTRYCILPITVGDHQEICLLYVTKLAANTPIILGLPWLKKHNPSIDWTSMSMRLDSWYCLNHCGSTGQPVLNIKRTLNRLSNYQAPTCEEEPEVPFIQLGPSKVLMP